MAEYINKDDVSKIVLNHKEHFKYESDMDELLADIDIFPSIEIADKDTREFVKKLHPTWDSGYAVGFNDGRRTERRFIEESKGIVHCKGCKYSEINLLDSNEEPQRWCKVGLAKAVNDNDYCSWGENENLNSGNSIVNI